VHRGRRAPCCAERAERLMDLLAADPRPVVIDVGRVVDGGSEADEVRRMVAISAKVSLLVTRACYLSLRRSLALSWRPTGVVLVEEDSRALGRADVEDVLGVPVVASIAIDPVIARAVDSGLLASRLPPGLGRSLADVA
jgi:hypothetical protein